MESSEAHPVSDRGFAESQGLQLLATHHPMLLSGKFGERSLRIPSPRNLTYIDSFGGLGGHPRRVAGGDARVARGLCRFSNG
jgi:hypothetical protein